MNFIKFGDSKKYIVFLHGWGADKKSFLFVKNYFQDYSKIFVDFSGFGESLKIEKPYFVSDYVSELCDLLKNFEIDELVIVGHSFGGRVAIKFCALMKNKFNNLKLCLVDSAGIKPKLSFLKKWKIFRYKYLKRRALKNEKLKYKLQYFGSDDYKKLSPVMKQTFVNIVNEDLSVYAKMIDCNCLIIWGENDKDTPIFMAKKLNKYIKESNLVILNNAGHFSFLDNMQEFLIVLDTFIKNK